MTLIDENMAEQATLDWFEEQCAILDTFLSRTMYRQAGHFK